jgi:hypothetical protein
MGLSLEYLTILMKTFKRSFEFLIFIMDHAILNQIDNPICDLEWNNFVYESIIKQRNRCTCKLYCFVRKILATKLDATDPIAIYNQIYTGLHDRYYENGFAARY